MVWQDFALDVSRTCQREHPEDSYVCFTRITVRSECRADRNDGKSSLKDYLRPDFEHSLLELLALGFLPLPVRLSHHVAAEGT